MHICFFLRTKHSVDDCKYMLNEYLTEKKVDGCCSRKPHLVCKFKMSFQVSVTTSILRK